MKIFFGLIIIIFLLHCCTPFNKAEKNEFKILRSYFKEMEYENIYPVGVGGGSTQGKTRLIAITFCTEDTLTIESARKKCIKAIDKLLTEINQNPNNEQYFNKFPCTPDMLKLGILSPEGELENSGSIKTVFIKEGNLFYLKDNPLNKEGPSIQVYKESYDKAKAIVKQQEYLS